MIKLRVKVHSDGFEVVNLEEFMKHLEESSIPIGVKLQIVKNIVKSPVGCKVLSNPVFMEFMRRADVVYYIKSLDNERRIKKTEDHLHDNPFLYQT